MLLIADIVYLPPRITTVKERLVIESLAVKKYLSFRIET